MIDENALLQLTQKLVQTPSTTGNEAAIVELLANEMQEYGFDEIIIDEYGSLLGIIRGPHPGPTLLMDAHCDTVGIAPGTTWIQEPFGGELHNKRLYGRGSSDMKGALAAMVIAAANIDRHNMAGTIAVCATVLEEVMEGAALGKVIARLQPDYVIIGEATGLRLNRGGRGRAEIQLEAIGKPAHSSTPQLGINAVNKLIPAVLALAKLPLGNDPLLGEGVIALTDIISDPYPGFSVIPSRCRATFDRRLLSGETPDSVVAEIENVPEMGGIQVKIAAGSHQTYTGQTLSGLKFFPAWQIPAEHPFVRTVRAGIQSSGLSAELGAYRFCTNATYSSGLAGIPTVGFGPSEESLAHIVDEYIACDQLTAAARGYAGIIQQINQYS